MHAARISARHFLIAALCVIAAAGCGSTAAPGSGGSAAGSSAAGSSAAGGAVSSSTPKGSLDVTVTGHAGAAPKHWTLQCDPAGGTQPDPAAACRVLQAVKDPFAPLPKHVMCPMIQVGTKTVTVTGTWFGKKVNLTLSDGGCGLGRWTEYGKIFN